MRYCSLTHPFDGFTLLWARPKVKCPTNLTPKARYCNMRELPAVLEYGLDPYHVDPSRAHLALASRMNFCLPKFACQACSLSLGC